MITLIVVQGIASSLFWLGLAQLGNPSSKRRSGDTEEVRLASEGWLPHPGQADLRRQGEEISLTEDVLPSLLISGHVQGDSWNLPTPTQDTLNTPAGVERRHQVVSWSKALALGKITANSKV